MPYKANDPHRYKIPKARYRMENWPVYDQGKRKYAAWDNAFMATLIAG
jgi:hypothetical protein